MYCTVNIAVRQISNQLQSLMSAPPGWQRCSLYAGVLHLAREQSSESIIHAAASMTYQKDQAHRRQITAVSKTVRSG